MKKAWAKAINKSSYLKVIGRHFLWKIKKKTLQKKFIFGKIAVGKKTACNFSKKSTSGTFHWKTNTKDR